MEGLRTSAPSTTRFAGGPLPFREDLAAAAHPLRFLDTVRKSCGMPCLWIAIRLKLRGANGSPSTVSTRAASRGGRPTFSARTRSPGLGLAQIGDRQLAPLLACSTGRSQAWSPSWWTTPSTSSLPLSSFFIGWAIQPLLLLLGAREDAVADAERRAPALALHHPQPRRRPFRLPALGHRPGAAAIVDVDDAQHRHLGHAAHLVEGAARARSRSAPRRPCPGAAP